MTGIFDDTYKLNILCIHVICWSLGTGRTAHPRKMNTISTVLCVGNAVMGRWEGRREGGRKGKQMARRRGTREVEAAVLSGCRHSLLVVGELLEGDGGGRKEPQRKWI